LRAKQALYQLNYIPKKHKTVFVTQVNNARLKTPASLVLLLEHQKLFWLETLVNKPKLIFSFQKIKKCFGGSCLNTRSVQNKSVSKKEPSSLEHQLLFFKKKREPLVFLCFNTRSELRCFSWLFEDPSLQHQKKTLFLEEFLV
jgi:hypothetical protein